MYTIYRINYIELTDETEHEWLGAGGSWSYDSKDAVKYTREAAVELIDEMRSNGVEGLGLAYFGARVGVY